MSATPATTAEGGRRWGSEFFAVLQRIGRSLMLPIAGLPAAALLLRLDQDDLLGPDRLPPGASTVEITNAPDDGGTIVTVVHAGLPAADAEHRRWRRRSRPRPVGESAASPAHGLDRADGDSGSHVCHRRRRAARRRRSTRRVRSLGSRRWRTMAVCAVTSRPAAQASPGHHGRLDPGHGGIGASHHIRDTTLAEDATHPQRPQIPPTPLRFDDRSGTRPEAPVDA
jgi:hypothetical protein